MPGKPDWSGHQILHGTDAVLAQQTISLTAGQSKTTANALVTRPGYLISILGSASASVSVPFVEVTIRWFDSTGTVQLGITDWIIPCTTSADTAIFGQGPCRGGSFTVTTKNLDGVHALSLTVAMYETSHHIARDDWRQSFSNSAPPGFTWAPNSDMPLGTLIVDQSVGNFPAGSTTYLLPLYDGVMSLSAESGTSNVTISVVTAVLSTNNFVFKLAAGVAQNNLIVPLSRQPYILTVANSGTSAATGWLHGVALEYAS